MKLSQEAIDIAREIAEMNSPSHPLRDIHLNTRLSDIGITEIEIFEMLDDIEDELEVTLDDNIFREKVPVSVRDIAEKIQVIMEEECLI